jgi:hypothetical protein
MAAIRSPPFTDPSPGRETLASWVSVEWIAEMVAGQVKGER